MEDKSKTITVFHDRKHNCEVTSDQIVPINYVVTLARTEDDYESKTKTITSAHEEQLGALGYKSPEYESCRNWDRWLNYTDLVFLRFEWTE